MLDAAVKSLLRTPATSIGMADLSPGHSTSDLASCQGTSQEAVSGSWSNWVPAAQVGDLG